MDSQIKKEKPEPKAAKVSSCLPPESIKAIAESIGIGGLPEKATVYVADDVTYRLKMIVQVNFTKNGLILYAQHSLTQCKVCRQPHKGDGHDHLTGSIV